MSCQQVPFGDILRLAQRKLAGDQLYPVMSITMHNGLVDQDQKFKKRIASEDISTYKVVKNGNLVVGFPIDEGVLGFQNKYEAAAVSPAYDIWESTGKHDFDRGYFERILRSPQARVIYAAKMRGTTNRRRTIPKDVFTELLFPLPPLAEQKRIAAILDAADALRAKRRESLAQLDTLLQSTFLDIFGDPVTNPKGWEEKTIEEIVSDTKLGLVRSSEEFGWDFPIPYVRMDALTIDGKFLPDKVQYTDANKKEKASYSLQPGDLLFNTRNSKELVGKVCVYTGPQGWLFNNNLMRIRFKGGIEPNVIAAQFQFQRVQRELEQRKSGTTSVFAVYWKSLKTLPVLVPPIDLQRRFATIVASIEAQKGRLRQHLAELDTLFASLQQRAFNGEMLP